MSEAQQRHKTAPTATAALGRALLGSLLMCCFRKDNEALQITFKGQGPLKGMQVLAESSGCVKGKVGNVICDLPIREDGKLDVGRAVGPGTAPNVSTSCGTCTIPVRSQVKPQHLQILRIMMYTMNGMFPTVFIRHGQRTVCLGGSAVSMVQLHAWPNLTNSACARFGSWMYALGSFSLHPNRKRQGKSPKSTIK